MHSAMVWYTYVATKRANEDVASLCRLHNGTLQADAETAADCEVATYADRAHVDHPLTLKHGRIWGQPWPANCFKLPGFMFQVLFVSAL